MWLFFLAALGVVVADQLTKLGIRSSLLEGQSLFEAGIFSITRVPPNTGAAFGLFQDQSFALARSRPAPMIATMAKANE